MFSHSSAALVFDLVMAGLTGQFFRVMSSIVSFVSLVALSMSSFAVRIAQPIEYIIFYFHAAKLSIPAPLSRSASCLRA